MQELINFRQKYPQYDDLDDTTLANMLAKKFSAYSDLPEKVKQSEQPQSMGAKYAGMLPTEMPDPKLAAAQALQASPQVSQFTKAMAQTQLPEQIIAGAYGAGKGLLGIPQIMAGREASQAAGEIAKEHPIISGAGELGGTLLSLYGVGGIFTPLASKTHVDLLMKGRMAQARFIPRIIQSGATFGTHSLLREASRQVQEGTFDPVKLSEETGKGAAWGITIGAGGAIADPVKRVVASGVGAGALTALNNLITEGKINPLDVGFSTVLIAGFTALNATRVTKSMRDRATADLTNAFYARMKQVHGIKDPAAKAVARGLADFVQQQADMSAGKTFTVGEMERATAAIMKKGQMLYEQFAVNGNITDIIKPDVVRNISNSLMVQPPQPSMPQTPIQPVMPAMPPPVPLGLPATRTVPERIVQPTLPGPGVDPIQIQPSLADIPTMKMRGEMQKIEAARDEELQAAREISKKEINKIRPEHSLWGMAKGKIYIGSLTDAGYNADELAKEWKIPYHFWSSDPQTSQSLDSWADEHKYEIGAFNEDDVPSDIFIEALKTERKGEPVTTSHREAVAQIEADLAEKEDEIRRKYGQYRQGIEQRFRGIQRAAAEEEQAEKERRSNAESKGLHSQEEIIAFANELTPEEITQIQQGIEQGLPETDIAVKALRYLETQKPTEEAPAQELPEKPVETKPTAEIKAGDEVVVNGINQPVKIQSVRTENDLQGNPYTQYLSQEGWIDESRISRKLPPITKAEPLFEAGESKAIPKTETPVKQQPTAEQALEDMRRQRQAEREVQHLPDERDMFQAESNKREVANFIDINRNFIEKEPQRIKENHQRAFLDEFGLKSPKDTARVITPIEQVFITPSHYNKIIEHIDIARKEFIGFIKPTLERPNEIWDEKGKHSYIKIFKNGDVKLHATIVTVKSDGNFYVTNIPISNSSRWGQIRKGDRIYSVAPKPEEGLLQPGNVNIPQTKQSVKTSTEKQPWEMTREEFLDNKKQIEIDAIRKIDKTMASFPGKTDTKTPAYKRAEAQYDKLFSEKKRSVYAERHRAEVEQALSEGKPVPAEVLDDYPDLVKTVTDPAKIQQIKNEIIEGEMRLKSGRKTSGEKYSGEELAMISRSVDRDKQKIGEYKAKPELRESRAKYGNMQKRAEQYFGITNNINKAGYITPDGKMLDFSGENQGNVGATERALDHRDVNEILPDDDPVLNAAFEKHVGSASPGMYYFMGLGNIRLTTSGFDTATKPTVKQWNILKYHMRVNPEDAYYVDVTDKEGNIINSFTYGKGTSIQKIINDVNSSFPQNEQEQIRTLEKEAAYMMKHGKVPPGARFYPEYKKSEYFAKYGDDDRSTKSEYYEFVTEKLGKLTGTKDKFFTTKKLRDNIIKEDLFSYAQRQELPEGKPIAYSDEIKLSAAPPIEQTVIDDAIDQEGDDLRWWEYFDPQTAEYEGDIPITRREAEMFMESPVSILHPSEGMLPSGMSIYRATPRGIDTTGVEGYYIKRGAIEFSSKPGTPGLKAGEVKNLRGLYENIIKERRETEFGKKDKIQVAGRENRIQRQAGNTSRIQDKEEVTERAPYVRKAFSSYDDTSQVIEETISAYGSPATNTMPIKESLAFFEQPATNKELQAVAKAAQEKKLSRTQVNRLLQVYAGKKKVSDLTGEEALAFLDIIDGLVMKWGNKPPSIPRTDKMSQEGFFDRDFKEPTAAATFTPSDMYARKLGVWDFVENLVKQSILKELEKRKIFIHLDKIGQEIDRAERTSRTERAAAFYRNRPTAAREKFFNLLDQHETAPDNLTPEETRIFNDLRALTKGMLERVNQVREAYGAEPIPDIKSYVTHIFTDLTRQQLQEKYPLPEELQYILPKIKPEHIFNPTALERTLKLDGLLKDPIRALKAMVSYDLKEIYLTAPMQMYNQQVKAVQMPATTRKWLEEYVNTAIKGFPTDADKRSDATLEAMKIPQALNILLKPFGRAIGDRPTKQITGALRHVIHDATIWGRLKLAIRNITQQGLILGLYPERAFLKSFLPHKEADGIVKDLPFYQVSKQIYFENLPDGAIKKLERIGFMPYGKSHELNCRRTAKAAYHATEELINNPKYANLGWTKADQEKEMEFAINTAQYWYNIMGMPELFRSETMKTAAVLQSWWMNYFFKYWREMATRGFTGKTSWGKEIPKSWRLGALRHIFYSLLFMQATKEAFGWDYKRIALAGVIPTSLLVSPTMQVFSGLWKATTGNEAQRKQGIRQMRRSLNAFVPGSGLYRDINKWMKGDVPVWDLFFYFERENKKNNYIKL